MRWHCPTTRAPRKKKGSTPPSPWFFDDPTNKPHRRLQETEAYIHLYYKERIVEPLRAEVADTDIKGPMINLIRKVAKDLYEKEDEPTRMAVAAYIETQAAATSESADLEQVEPTPEQYQE